MRRLILTLNIGEYWGQNSQESFQAAADRWGAELVSVSTHTLPDHHPTFEKFLALDRLKYDRVLFLDADMLIAASAPNPFELFSDPSQLYTCCDLGPHTPARAVMLVSSVVHWDFYQELNEKYALGVTPEQYMNGFWNGGMFLASRDYHAPFFARLAAELPVPEHRRHVGIYEQALFNYMSRAMCKVRLVSQTWNRLDPDLNKGRYNIYHFTGATFTQKDARHTFDWRAV